MSCTIKIDSKSNDHETYVQCEQRKMTSVFRYEGPGKGAGQLGICPGRRDANGKICNVGAGDSGFHTPKNFFELYPQFGHAPSKFHQPRPRPKDI